MPFTEETKKPLTTLAKAARRTLEVLLEARGWTWDEALSRAIDRLIQIEEEQG